MEPSMAQLVYIFEGTRLSSEFEGQVGYVFYSNGDVYQGEMIDETPHGRGSLWYANSTLDEITPYSQSAIDSQGPWSVWSERVKASCFSAVFRGVWKDGARVLGQMTWKLSKTMLHAGGVSVSAEDDFYVCYEGHYQADVEHGWGKLSLGRSSEHVTAYNELSSVLLHDDSNGGYVDLFAATQQQTPVTTQDMLDFTVSPVTADRWRDVPQGLSWTALADKHHCELPSTLFVDLRSIGGHSPYAFLSADTNATDVSTLLNSVGDSKFDRARLSHRVCAFVALVKAAIPTHTNLTEYFTHNNIYNAAPNHLHGALSQAHMLNPMFGVFFLEGWFQHTHFTTGMQRYNSRSFSCYYGSSVHGVWDGDGLLFYKNVDPFQLNIDLLIDQAFSEGVPTNPARINANANTALMAPRDDLPSVASLLQQGGRVHLGPGLGASEVAENTSKTLLNMVVSKKMSAETLSLIRRTAALEQNIQRGLLSSDSKLHPPQSISVNALPPSPALNEELVLAYSASSLAHGRGVMMKGSFRKGVCVYGQLVSIGYVQAAQHVAPTQLDTAERDLESCTSLAVMVYEGGFEYDHSVVDLSQRSDTLIYIAKDKTVLDRLSDVSMGRRSGSAVVQYRYVHSSLHQHVYPYETHVHRLDQLDCLPLFIKGEFVKNTLQSGFFRFQNYTFYGAVDSFGRLKQGIWRYYLPSASTPTDSNTNTGSPSSSTVVMVVRGRYDRHGLREGDHDIVFPCHGVHYKGAFTHGCPANLRPADESVSPKTVGADCVLRFSWPHKYAGSTYTGSVSKTLDMDSKLGTLTFTKNSKLYELLTGASRGGVSGVCGGGVIVVGLEDDSSIESVLDINDILNFDVDVKVVEFDLSMLMSEHKTYSVAVKAVTHTDTQVMHPSIPLMSRTDLYTLLQTQPSVWTLRSNVLHSIQGSFSMNEPTSVRVKLIDGSTISGQVEVVANTHNSHNRFISSGSGELDVCNPDYLTQWHTRLNQTVLFAFTGSATFNANQQIVNWHNKLIQAINLTKTVVEEYQSGSYITSSVTLNHAVAEPTPKNRASEMRKINYGKYYTTDEDHDNPRLSLGADVFNETYVPTVNVLYLQEPVDTNKTKPSSGLKSFFSRQKQTAETDVSVVQVDDSNCTITQHDVLSSTAVYVDLHMLLALDVAVDYNNVYGLSVLFAVYNHVLIHDYLLSLALSSTKTIRDQDKTTDECVYVLTPTHPLHVLHPLFPLEMTATLQFSAGVRVQAHAQYVCGSVFEGHFDTHTHRSGPGKLWQVQGWKCVYKLMQSCVYEETHCCSWVYSGQFSLVFEGSFLNDQPFDGQIIYQTVKNELLDAVDACVSQNNYIGGDGVCYDPDCIYTECNQVMSNLMNRVYHSTTQTSSTLVLDTDSSASTSPSVCDVEFYSTPLLDDYVAQSSTALHASAACEYTGPVNPLLNRGSGQGMCRYQPAPPSTCFSGHRVSVSVVNNHSNARIKHTLSASHMTPSASLSADTPLSTAATQLAHTCLLADDVTVSKCEGYWLHNNLVGPATISFTSDSDSSVSLSAVALHTCTPQQVRRLVASQVVKGTDLCALPDIDTVIGSGRLSVLQQHDTVTVDSVQIQHIVRFVYALAQHLSTSLDRGVWPIAGYSWGKLNNTHTRTDADAVSSQYIGMIDRHLKPSGFGVAVYFNNNNMLINTFVGRFVNGYPWYGTRSFAVYNGYYNYNSVFYNTMISKPLALGNFICVDNKVLLAMGVDNSLVLQDQSVYNHKTQLHSVISTLLSQHLEELQNAETTVDSKVGVLSAEWPLRVKKDKINIPVHVCKQLHTFHSAGGLTPLIDTLKHAQTIVTKTKNALATSHESLKSNLDEHKQYCSRFDSQPQELSQDEEYHKQMLQQQEKLQAEVNAVDAGTDHTHDMFVSVWRKVLDNAGEPLKTILNGFECASSDGLGVTDISDSAVQVGRRLPSTEDYYSVDHALNAPAYTNDGNIDHTLSQSEKEIEDLIECVKKEDFPDASVQLSLLYTDVIKMEAQFNQSLTTGLKAALLDKAYRQLKQSLHYETVVRDFLACLCDHWTKQATGLILASVLDLTNTEMCVVSGVSKCVCAKYNHVTHNNTSISTTTALARTSIGNNDDFFNIEHSRQYSSSSTANHDLHQESLAALDHLLNNEPINSPIAVTDDEQPSFIAKFLHSVSANDYNSTTLKTMGTSRSSPTTSVSPAVSVSPSLSVSPSVNMAAAKSVEPELSFLPFNISSLLATLFNQECMCCLPTATTTITNQDSLTVYITQLRQHCERTMDKITNYVQTKLALHTQHYVSALEQYNDLHHFYSNTFMNTLEFSLPETLKLHTSFSLQATEADKSATQVFDTSVQPCLLKVTTWTKQEQTRRQSKASNLRTAELYHAVLSDNETKALALVCENVLGNGLHGQTEHTYDMFRRVDPLSVNILGYDEGVVDDEVERLKHDRQTVLDLAVCRGMYLLVHYMLQHAHNAQFKLGNDLPLSQPLSQPVVLDHWGVKATYIQAAVSMFPATHEVDWYKLTHAGDKDITHHARNQGLCAVLMYLYGANIATPNAENNTALTVAAITSNAHQVDLVANLGTSRALHLLKTALTTQAAQCGRLDLKLIFPTFPVTPHLIATERLSRSLDSPLHISCSKGNEATVHALLRAGSVRLNWSNHNGQTPLDLAATIEIATLLAHFGARAGHKNTNGTRGGANVARRINSDEKAVMAALLLAEKKFQARPTGLVKQNELLNESDTRWSADKDHKLCVECSASFSFFNRKHHCRLCGLVYCHGCTTHKVSDEPNQTHRVCDGCSNRVHEM